MCTSCRTLWVIPLIILSVVSAAISMPPHPQLLQRIQSGEIAVPYALSHNSEIRRQGVDAPARNPVTGGRHRASLDEDFKLIAILVDFSDQPFLTTAGYFDTLLFGNASGSLKHYYTEVSYGNLTLITLNRPGLLGWKRAPQTYNYYVNGVNGFGVYPYNAQRLAEDAVLAVDSEVNFANYDNDGDGFVEGLFIIHSGPGAESSGSDNDIWSHAWSLHSPLSVDNVTIVHYSMEPEYYNQNGDMTCGVFAHEMGHAVFGLPDLYDTDYNSRGLGVWSLMASGSWNGNWGESPAHPDAYCRTLMGFANPTVITANLSNVAIAGVETSPVIYRLWTNGTAGSQYFLVENRRQTGYDSYLPRSGLLIYHIDESAYGNDNQWYPGYTTNGHYEAALEQADGLWALERDSSDGDGGDPFPGDSNKTAFSYNSIPNSRNYHNGRTFVGIRNISASSNTAYADFAVRPGIGNSILAQLSDTVAAADELVAVNVIVDSVTVHNITNVQLRVDCDTAVVCFAAPYYDATGSLIPQTWTISQTHSAGSLVISASGTPALTGAGTLLRLTLHVLPDIAEGSMSPLAFREFIVNQGTPPVDTANGSLTVGTPRIVFQPTFLDFGNVLVGTELARLLIIRNMGNATLIVHTITPPAGFTTDVVGPLVLTEYTYARIRVAFTPDSVRAYQDSLTVLSNAVEGPARIPLTGNGIASVSTESAGAARPAKLALHHNYPNPFNASTVIAFDLPATGCATLRIVDVLGREVAVPVRGLMQAGTHRIVFDGGNLSAGIYFAQLTSGNDVETIKFMLLK